MEYDKMAAEIGSLAKSEEDVLSYALFPQVAKDFLSKR
jgi:oxaloacetate decarboxylase alpha subunit